MSFALYIVMMLFGPDGMTMIGVRDSIIWQYGTVYRNTS